MVCYLASVHSALQVTRADHPGVDGAAVDSGAGTLSAVDQRDGGLLERGGYLTFRENGGSTLELLRQTPTSALFVCV